MFDRESTLNLFLIGYLQQIVADLADDRLAHQHYPGCNHPAWVLGHLAIVADSGLVVLRRTPRCPPTWRELFKPGSQPQSERSRYPAKTDLMGAIESGYAAVRDAARGADPTPLREPHSFAPLLKALPTKSDMLAHLLTTHFAAHTAQVSAWRRQDGSAPLF